MNSKYYSFFKENNQFASFAELEKNLNNNQI
jgi:hypothetical protein